MTLTAGELCAGYGGLALAVEEVFGAETAWFFEFDAAPSKILKHHWPNVPNHGDMTLIAWAAIEQVDIISGGTPCQDLSHAGRRAGMTEGTRSNLWVNMREAIATQRPKWVVWENVRGAYSAEADSDMEFCPGCMGNESDCYLRALGRVLGDLSDLGYDTQWRGLRASDVGAPHARFRVFVLARLRTACNRDNSGRGEHGRPFAIQQKHAATEHSGTDVAHAVRGGSRGGSAESFEGRRDHATVGPDTGAAATHSEGDGWREGRTKPAGIFRRLAAPRDCAPPAYTGSSTIGERSGGSSTEETWEGGRDRSGDHHREQPPTNWGPYEPAIRRWERSIGRRAPRPTEPTGRDGAERLSPRFTEWMMGLDDGWVTDPAIGITRNEQLKACGNGVVPQQAIAALRDMLAAFATPVEAAA